MPKTRERNGKKEWTCHDNFPSECKHTWEDYKEEGVEFGWQYCPKCGLQRFKELKKECKKYDTKKDTN